MSFHTFSFGLSSWNKGNVRYNIYPGEKSAQPTHMFSPTPTRKFNIDEKAPLLGLDYFFCLAADLYVVHNVAYFFLLKIGRNSSLTTLAYCKCSAKLIFGQLQE